MGQTKKGDRWESLPARVSSPEGRSALGVLVPARAEDEVYDVPEDVRRHKEDDEDDPEPIQGRRRAISLDVRRLGGAVVRPLDVDREQARDDVQEEDGETDQVQLDEVDVGVALGVLE